MRRIWPTISSIWLRRRKNRRHSNASSTFKSKQQQQIKRKLNDHLSSFFFNNQVTFWRLICRAWKILASIGWSWKFCPASTISNRLSTRSNSSTTATLSPSKRRNSNLSFFVSIINKSLSLNIFSSIKRLGSLIDGHHFENGSLRSYLKRLNFNFSWRILTIKNIN